MPAPKDDVIAQLVIEKGWLTPQQVEDCKKARFNLPSDPEMTLGRASIKPLGVVMIEMKLITPPQMTELIAEHNRRIEAVAAYERTANAEMPLGQVLVRQNKATQLQINKCLDLQRKQAEKGVSPVTPLQQLLVEQGFVDAATMASMAKLHERSVLICTSCAREFTVVGVEAGKTYKCRFCQGILVTQKMRESMKSGGAAPGAPAEPS